MRTSSPLALFSFLALSACGGDDGVDIVGDTPEEAADEIVNATCGKQADCGVWRISLDFDDQGNVTECIPTHEESDRAECISDDREDIREILECAMLTDDEAEMINECVNDTLDQDCISEEEINAFCDGLVAGEDPEEPGGLPASCDALQAIFEGC